MSHGTWLHRGLTPLVRPLAATSITPNHLTAARLVTGLCAVAAFASASPTWQALGGGLFLVSMLLDRADGILARLGGKSSRFGHVFDLIADYTVTALLFVGIGIGASSGALGGLAIWLGTLAGISITLMFWLAYLIEQMVSPGESALPSKAGFDPDDILLAVAPVAWLGWLEPFLILASVGAPLAALIFIGFHARQRRRLGGREKQD
jgi:phosphatidylglycerophosphate synthase